MAACPLWRALRCRSRRREQVSPGIPMCSLSGTQREILWGGAREKWGWRRNKFIKFLVFVGDFFLFFLFFSLFFFPFSRASRSLVDWKTKGDELKARVDFWFIWILSASGMFGPVKCECSWWKGIWTRRFACVRFFIRFHSRCNVSSQKMR